MLCANVYDEYISYSRIILYLLFAFVRIILVKYPGFGSPCSSIIYLYKSMAVEVHWACVLGTRSHPQTHKQTHTQCSILWEKLDERLFICKFIWIAWSMSLTLPCAPSTAFKSYGNWVKINWDSLLLLPQCIWLYCFGILAGLALVYINDSGCPEIGTMAANGRIMALIHIR